LEIVGQFVYQGTENGIVNLNVLPFFIFLRVDLGRNANIRGFGFKIPKTSVDKSTVHKPDCSAVFDIDIGMDRKGVILTKP
jgi:hypothetical protein